VNYFHWELLPKKKLMKPFEKSVPWQIFDLFFLHTGFARNFGKKIGVESKKMIYGLSIYL
jgi:hypothetical protein